LAQKHLKIENLTHSLNHLNPESVLRRGYAIVTRKDDHQIIKRTEQVQTADLVLIQVSQGSMEAKITQKKQESKDERSKN
jgi:exodeoxyribonuclease VII large subunit